MKPIALSKRRPTRVDGAHAGGCVLAFLPKKERHDTDRHGWHSVHYKNLKNPNEQESLHKAVSGLGRYSSARYTHWVPYPKFPTGHANGTRT